LYSVWIKIDKTFPWIELKGEHETRRAAKQAAQIAIGRIAVRLVNMSQETKAINALITVRARR